MNNTLHTPAPWKHDSTWGIIKYGKTEICALHSGNLANAHLISAAPDLLSALETLLSAVEFIECQSDEGRLFSIERLHMGHDKGIREAKEAIAKAKGAA
jgi:hypothetical protein